MKTTKKLIEVALPLEAINTASAREKSIRHGHPSTLHLWWARRPLAAARAVIFAQMVDDPSEYVDTLRSDPKLKRKAESVLQERLKLWHEARDLVGKTEGTNLDVPEPGPEPTLDAILADLERQRLFRIIEQLVQWENTTNETVLQAARDEIWSSWRRACAENADHPRAKELFDRKKLPAFHDPFAGGGALPLEAQRLGLESYASDLNPVAVLINKAMIEIPPRFAGRGPVNPRSRREEGRGGRSEREEGVNALSGDDCLAEGNGGDPGGLPSGSASSTGGTIRDEIAVDAINGLGSVQYCRGMDSRDESGQGALPGNSPGLPRGSGDLADTVRAARLVSRKRDYTSEEAHGRGQPDADSDASQPQGVTSQSSLFFPHSYRGAQGLAEDVRYYGQWMRDEPETYHWLLVPEQMTPQAPVDWQAVKLGSSDALAVRVSKKLRSDETLVLSLGATILRKHLDDVPLWRGDHVAVKQLIEDFARYLYLPRIAGPEVLVQAMQDGVALLTWHSDSFAYAESYDQAGGRYRGLHGGQVVTLSEDSAGVLVKPGVAQHQIDAETKPAIPPGPSEGGLTGVGPGTSDGQSGQETDTMPGGGSPTKVAPRRFYGTVVVDPARAGRDAGRIADEVIAHLVGQLGAEVTVTIEIQANLPSGASDQLVRIVTENSRTLKFTSLGFESE